MVDQEIQTEHGGKVDASTQKPEDANPQKLMDRYIENQNKIQAIGLGKKKNADLGNNKL